MSIKIRCTTFTAALSLIPIAFAGTISVHADAVAVTTMHNDNMRTGANLSETILTPQNVNTVKFGKLFTLPLDSNVLGQPLYVPNVTINGATHNVIYAVTGTGGGGSGTNNSPCSVYAYDADDTSIDLLWRLQLAPNGQWMTGTPVIDTSTDTIYLVTKANNNSGATLLHAVDMISGVEKKGSPIKVAASMAGTGSGSVNGELTFDSGMQNDRSALLLVKGDVYFAFCHAEDTPPFHGWVFGYHYNGTHFTRTGVFCDTPNGSDGGIWMGGAGPAADSAGNIYLLTGNGTFDINKGGTDYGMSALRLTTPGLSVADYFTPEEEPEYASQDKDLNAHGVVLIPGENRLFTGISKYGSAYLLDTTNLGGFAPASKQTNIVQALDNLTGDPPYGFNPVCFDTGTIKYLYMWPGDNSLLQYSYDPSAGMLSPATPINTYNGTGGATLAVSANGGNDGIVWAGQFNGSVSAYDASNVSTRLWSSIQNKSRDAITSITHFGSITVTNGKVYVPTGNAEIAVYGLLPPPTVTTQYDVADSTIKAGSDAKTNYGSTTTFAVHRGSNNSGNASDRAAYFQFDLTNVTTVPKSAFLTLHLNSNSIAGSGSSTYNIYGSIASWSESGLTWSDAPDLDKGNFSFKSTLITSQAIPAQEGPVRVDVTSYVASNLGSLVTFEMDDPSIDGATLYGDTKEGQVNVQPKLTLTD